VTLRSPIQSRCSRDCCGFSSRFSAGRDDSAITAGARWELLCPHDVANASMSSLSTAVPLRRFSVGMSMYFLRWRSPVEGGACAGPVTYSLRTYGIVLRA
jgi:hypothetical protein